MIKIGGLYAGLEYVVGYRDTRIVYIINRSRQFLDWFRDPYHKGLLSEGSTKTAFVTSGSSDKVAPVQTDYRLLVELGPILPTNCKRTSRLFRLDR